MKNIIVCILSFGSVLALTNCHFQFQEIVDKPISKTQLAFICELKNGTYQNLSTLTFTSNIGQPITWNYVDTSNVINPLYSSLYFNFVNGASVEIFKGGNLFKKFNNIFLYQYAIDGITNFDYNKEYMLKVYKEGYDSVIGTQTFPRDYFMDTSRIKLNKNTVVNSKFGGLSLSELIFEINDSINEKNSYTFRAEINNSRTEDTVLKFGQELPLYYIDKNSLIANLITDSTFNGKKYFWHVGVNLDTLSFRTPFPYSPKQKLSIVIYFKSVCPDYILYVKSVQSGAGFSVNSPNTEPTSPFYNMKGGAGLFITSGQEYRIEIPVNY